MIDAAAVITMLRHTALHMPLLFTLLYDTLRCFFFLRCARQHIRPCAHAMLIAAADVFAPRAAPARHALPPFDAAQRARVRH